MKKQTTSKDQQDRFAWATLACFFGLNVGLLKRHHTSIPGRDFAASLVGAALVLVAILLARTLDPKGDKLRPTHQVRRVFYNLTVFEVFVTIVLPWFVLNYGRLVERTPEYAIFGRVDSYDVLTPHVFAVQTQILLEMLIVVSGQANTLLLPFTCIANLYRTLPLLHWIYQAKKVLEEDAQLTLLQQVLVVGPPLMASALWFFTTMIFLPFEWLPRTRWGNEFRVEKVSATDG